MNALLEASAPLFASAFALWGAQVTWLEIAAFALAIAMVVANIRVAPVAWPLAIASSLLYFLLFWQSRLYGEASLQILFVAVSFWGWWQWLRGTDAAGRALRVRALSARGLAIAVAALALAWPTLALFLDRFSDSDVPWLDALPTAGSVLGQWLLARKFVENWPVWLAVNVASVVLFSIKGLWLTVLLYAVFVVMSAFGWRAWRRLARP